MAMNITLKKLALILTMSVILLSFVECDVQVSPSSYSARKIDVFTTKKPFDGKGINQSSDAFQPNELVILYANVTYNDYPTANQLVGFRIDNSPNAFKNITTVYTSLTNQSGIAQVSFRIPWPDENAEQIIFGEWTVIATADIGGELILDTLTFQVGWIVQVTNITTLNAKLEFQTRFQQGETVFLNLTVKNIALTNKRATIIINVHDTAKYPIAYVEKENLIFQPGESNVSAFFTIPLFATIGVATIAAAPYTDSPGMGGAPYCPALTTEVEITTFTTVTSYLVTFSQEGLSVDVSGTILTVNGTQLTFNDLPYSILIDEGSEITYSYENIVSSSILNKRFMLKSVAGPVSPVIVTANATIKGNYVAQFKVTFEETGLDSSAIGNVVTINNVSKNYIDLPYSFWADNEAIINYSYNSTLSSSVSGKRFKIVSVISSAAPLIVTEPTTIVGNYKTQYFLSIRTNPQGVAAIPGEGWHDALENVTLTAVTVSGYDFEKWDVDGTSFAVGVKTITVFMDRAHIATAHYSISVGGEYIPWWFYWLLFLLLLLAIILLVLWLSRRREKKKASLAFQRGWTAWYYGYNIEERPLKFGLK
jgi:hypothetical protein